MLSVSLPLSLLPSTLGIDKDKQRMSALYCRDLNEEKSEENHQRRVKRGDSRRRRGYIALFKPHLDSVRGT